MQLLTVTEKEAGGRFDKYLGRYMKEAPVSFFYKMMRKKNIVLNGKKAAGSEILAAGDEIKLFLSDETIEKFGGRVQRTDSAHFIWNQPQPEVLYEDDHVLILNKPVGVLSQKAKKDDVSLVEWVTDYLLRTGNLTEEELNTFHPGVCNRLDRNTSGIILAGKTLFGLQTLSKMLSERTVHKYYLTVVRGQVAEKKRIEGYLFKKEQHNTVEIYQKPAAGASYIQTEYEPLADNGEYTLLKVNLITGKSHQIRAHLASIGHPVIGDGKYGYRRTNEVFRRMNLNSQFLHAWLLEFPEFTEVQTAGAESVETAVQAGTDGADGADGTDGTDGTDGVVQGVDVSKLSGLSGRTIRAEVPETFQRVLRNLNLKVPD